jgi:NAD(P)-dependent dehydrogenase (short-subunit alcohol dehydrogenase family)
VSKKQTDRGFVVTGTSTGIGAVTALHLAGKGFHVFAGVRCEADGEALQSQSPARLTPLIIDVTDAKTILAAAAAVTDAVGDRGLAGLINNAGIAKPAPIELQPMADFREQLEVNLFGPVAMVQAFLPLIRAGGGRIVNVGSIGGLLVLPLNGAYSASKFGIRAVTDALRLELRQWKIHVSLIEVAPVATAIFGKTYAELDALEEKLGETGYRLYAEQIAAVRTATEKAAASADPALVIGKAIAEALTADRPKPRYLVGHGGREVAAVAALPDRARDKALARELGLPKPAQHERGGEGAANEYQSESERPDRVLQPHPPGDAGCRRDGRGSHRAGVGGHESAHRVHRRALRAEALGVPDEAPHAPAHVDSPGAAPPKDR